MTNTAESPVITFSVTSAFELPGMRVERSLGVTFGLVVRSMGFSKAVTTPVIICVAYRCKR